MATFANLNDEGFEVLSRIMTRSAKNLGLYNRLSIAFMHNGFNTLKEYLRNRQGLDIISSCVGTYWQLMFNELKNAILSSFFIVSIITDERIFFVERCAGENNEYNVRFKIRDNLYNEVSFLLQRSDFEWARVPRNRIKYFIDIIKSKKEFFNNSNYNDLISVLERKLPLAP